MSSPEPFSQAEASAARIAERTAVPRHDIAVVFGSGWAPAADVLGTPRAEIGFHELGYPAATVPGHAGVVRSIDVQGRNVLAFLGRVHLYEGHEVSTVVHGVRTAVLAGCATVVLTNAAGGLRSDMRPGQPVLISDHINLTARSPLTGPNPPAPFPIRFVDLTDLYSKRLRALARSIEPTLTEGVYVAFPGPHYETPAEIVMVRTMGGDLVGMSTALEAIAARHLGAEVLGVSLVTNLAAGITGEPLDHAEVVAAGRSAAVQMGALLRRVVVAL